MTFGAGNEQEFIGKLKQLTLDHLEDEKFGGKELALALGMSWSTLNRKVQAITGKHISQLIREIRLQKALELLQENNATAAEVAYKVGFGGPAYFNKSFKEFFGFPPGEVKKRMAEGILKKIEEDQTSKNFPEVEKPNLPQPERFKKSFLFSATVVLVLLIIAFSFIYLVRKGVFSNEAAVNEIIIAILPFQNLTKDATKDFWEVMIQDNLINSLSNEKDLKVRQTQTVNSLLESYDLTNYSSITPALARSVSQKLDANIFLQGSINKIGTITRLNVKLINSRTEEVLKSFQLDSNPENIIQLADSITLLVKNFLIVNFLKKGLPPHFQRVLEASNRPINPEAFRYYLEGMNSFGKDYPRAREMYFKALEIDPDFILPMIYLTSVYNNQGLFQDAKKWSKVLYEKKNKVSRIENLAIEAVYATYFGTPAEVIKYYKLLLEIDDKASLYYYMIGLNFYRLSQYDMAIPALEKNLELIKMRGLKPDWVPKYTLLGSAYQKTGQYRKAKKLYKKAEKDFPDDPLIIRRQAILALARGKTKQADEYLAKFESLIRNEGASEALIQTQLAFIFEEAGMNDKAEKHFRNALGQEPENPVRMNIFATFLIKHDKNISEGMGLIEKALEIRPDNYIWLHTKGLGLYKQGKYPEALEILQKSWDLRRELAVYDHEAFLNLEEAKKAVASLK